MSDIPVFRLYGEHSDWWEPDLLHVESIARRSSLHNWEIRAHRHSNLYQVLYLQHGQAEITIEGAVYRVSEPCIQWIPPLSVHGFRFSDAVQGWILTMATPLVDHIERAMSRPFLLKKTPLSLEKANRKTIDLLFTALEKEYEYNLPGRQPALEARIVLLLVWIQRRSLEEDSQRSPPSRGRVYFQRFSALVEKHYSEQWSMQKYAAELGISAVRLNQICRQLSNQTALQFIHHRLLLEAKRELIYTTLTIAQISDNLGFSEPAYFTRFFKRLTGRAPNQFRQNEAMNLSAGTLI